MNGEGGPVFLARKAYFRRRLTDAARLLPVLGIGLIVLPLLWSAPATLGDDGHNETRTVEVMLYLFMVWIGLAGLAGLISRRLSVQDDAQTAPTDPETKH